MMKKRERRGKIFWYYIVAFVISSRFQCHIRWRSSKPGRDVASLICAIKSKRFSNFIYFLRIIWIEKITESSDPRLFWLKHDWFNYIQIIHRGLIREPSFRYRDNFLSLRLCYARNNNINVSHASLLLVKPKILWRNYWFQLDPNRFIAWIEFSFMDFLVLKLLSRSFRCMLSARLLCKPILCSGMCHSCLLLGSKNASYRFQLKPKLSMFSLVLIALTLK